ncbi:hypothetical protein CN150_35420, partial [Sinorhizobium meliloti]
MNHRPSPDGDRRRSINWFPATERCPEFSIKNVPSISTADSDEAAPLFRDDCAPGFRDDLAPCLVGSAGD